MACYEFSSSRVNVRSYEGRESVYPASAAMPRSDELRARVQRIAEACGFGWIDATPRVRAAARSELLHGPKDFGHFNRAGYTLLGEILAEGLSSARPEGPWIRAEQFSRRVAWPLLHPLRIAHDSTIALIARSTIPRRWKRERAHTKPRGRWRKRLLAVLLGFVLLEVGARVWLTQFASERSYTRYMPLSEVPRPRGRTAGTTTSITRSPKATSAATEEPHNALGYRGDEIEAKKPGRHLPHLGAGRLDRVRDRHRRLARIDLGRDAAHPARRARPPRGRGDQRRLRRLDLLGEPDRPVTARALAPA
jgi:hypothetical protein